MERAMLSAKAADNSASLAFLRIDADTRRRLEEFWRVAQPRLPEILDGFYRHVGSIPALAAMVGAQAGRLKPAQRAHWERLFSGQFDDSYFASVRAIGIAHNRIGLEPKWFIGGCHYVRAQLSDVAVEHYRWSPGRLKAALRAIDSAIMLDMATTITTYQEALVSERAARGEKLARLLRGFDDKAQALLASVAEAGARLHATARAMSAAASQATGQTASAASASEEASVNVQTIATAAAQLSRSVVEILHQVSESSGIANVAVEQARGANQTMQDLVENAGRISAVVQLIQTIASQTNLLALNATIEAARAGEAGKGFAVVANEVKSLASQTARATEEIALSVRQIQAATRNASAALVSIGATIEELSENALNIAGGVEQQGAATREIAHGVQEAAQGTRDVAANIIGVSQTADLAGKTADEVLEAAQNLSRHSAQLNDEVRSFIQRAQAV
jgi:methyl-accepting chemotaxis protein